MNYSRKKILLFAFFGVLFWSCSNKVNTWSHRQFHMATTRWNVLFNAKESYKKGQETIKKDFIENFDELLPIYRENNIEVRARAEGNMKRVVDKMVKAIELHSITAKPKRKKGKRDSQKYREFRRKKEYNNLIEQCYLLLGKGQFYRREYYSTERTFRYIIRTYKDLPIRHEASIWYARTLAEQNKLFRALRTLKDAMEDKDFSDDLQNMANEAKADFLIRQEKYKDAIEPLEYLVKNTKKDEGQTRYFYLLAQLYSQQKEYAKAQKTYDRLLNIHPDNRYAFQASLSKAMLYQKINESVGDDNLVIKQLKRLLRDGRNARFLDQVYYTMGKVYESEGKVDLAIENYEKSVEENKDNDKQKVKTLMALATINFKKKKDYVAALKNYELVKNEINQDDEEGKEIALRIESLRKLAENLGVVKMQDSLQQIARMPAVEREKVIKKMLLADEKKNRKRGRKARKQFSKAIKSVDRPVGDWYFYNPFVVASGKQDFEKKWGEIELTDDWTIEKQPIKINDRDDKTGDRKDPLGGTPSYVDYVANLPVTPAKMRQSNKQVVEALYNIGLIYEEELSDYPKAKDAFKEMLARGADDEKFIVNGNYHLFLLNTFEDNYAEANRYKEKIIREYPEHSLSKVLKDPAYYAKLEQLAKDAETLYQKSYEAYSKHNYAIARPLVNEGLQKYKDIVWYEKFLLLDAMMTGYAGSVEEFEKALDKVLRETRSKEMIAVVNEMKEQLHAGKRPNKQITENAKEWSLSDFENTKTDEEIAREIAIETISVEIPKAYKDLSKEKHCLAIILPKDMKGKIIEKLNKFIDENQPKGERLSVSRRGFGLNTDIILVEPLADKTTAQVFLKDFLPQKDYIMRGVNEVDYKTILVAEPNLRKLTVDKDIDAYSDFYEEYYTDTVVSNGKSYLGNNSNEKTKVGQVKPYNGIYKYSSKAVYNFVLLVPKKGVNVNYLWMALHKFDKKYKVKKETLNKDYRMLVVQGVGNEKEAIKYLQKVVTVKYIYGVIENVDYRNFIISKENIALLKKTKALDDYITFFKSKLLK